MTTISCLDHLGIRPSGDGWVMPLTPRASGGGGTLFGGAGLAAAVAALEASTGRPAIWVTAQFIAPSTVGRDLSIDVDIAKAGRAVTQASASVSDDDGLVLHAIGACGTRTERHRVAPTTMPQAPPPENSAIVDRGDGPSVHQHVQVRMARGMFGFVGTGEPTSDGSTLQWIRMSGIDHDSVALALISDYIVSALGNALGAVTGATSLDNTIRFTGPVVPVDDWLLVESHVQSVGNGFGITTGRIWQRDGQLLATASQSYAVFDMPSA